MNIEEIKNFILYGDYPTSLLIKKGLKVGEGFSRQGRSIIDKNFVDLITIGNYVTLAPRSYILAHDASTKKSLNYTKIGKVVIGDNVFLGAGSIVLPGVKIGDNVIVGAGSVVSKDVSSNIVVAGNPAKEIMKYSKYIESKEKDLDNKIFNSVSQFLKGNISQGYIK